MELFNSKTIKKLIEFKWPLTKEYTIKKLFVPFILFQFFYLFYMNWVYFFRYGEVVDKSTGEVIHKNFWFITNIVFKVILCLFSLHFLVRET